jgi:hypothetical protein
MTSTNFSLPSIINFMYIQSEILQTAILIFYQVSYRLMAFLNSFRMSVQVYICVLTVYFTLSNKYITNCFLNLNGMLNDIFYVKFTSDNCKKCQPLQKLQHVTPISTSCEPHSQEKCVGSFHYILSSQVAIYIVHSLIFQCFVLEL